MGVTVVSASAVICPGNWASNSTVAKAAELAGLAAALATAREFAISFRCFRLMVLRWRLVLGAGVGVGVGVGSLIDQFNVECWMLNVREKVDFEDFGEFFASCLKLGDWSKVFGEKRQNLARPGQILGHRSKT